MKKQGFTLIELLIVITIIAILAGAAIPYVQQYVEDARYAKAKQDMDEIKNGLIRYETDRGTIYPGGPNGNMSGLVGPYINKAFSDPWGGPYVIDSDASKVYAPGPDGVAKNGDDVVVDFRPPLAISKAYWEDTDNNGSVSIDDSIVLKFTRPVDKMTPADFQHVDNYGYPGAGAFASGWPAADADFKAVAFTNNDMTVTLTIDDTTNIIGGGAVLFTPGKDTISILNANANQIEDVSNTACKSGANTAVPIKAR